MPFASVVRSVREEGPTILIEGRGRIKEHLVLRTLRLLVAWVEELQRARVSLVPPKLSFTRGHAEEIDIGVIRHQVSQEDAERSNHVHLVLRPEEISGKQH